MFETSQETPLESPLQTLLSLAYSIHNLKKQIEKIETNHDDVQRASAEE